MAPALILGLVSIGAPWLVVDIPTGASATAGWSSVAPASFSLALAAIAAWGASLLTRERATRVLGVVHTLLAAGSLFALGRALSDTDQLVGRLAGEASGVIGAIPLSDTLQTWSPTWIGVAIVAIIGIGLSGVWAVASPGTKDSRGSRYERPETNESSDPWQALSDGDDPTSR